MNNQGKSIIKLQKILVELMTIWILMVTVSVFSRQEPNNIGLIIWIVFVIGSYLLIKALFKSQLTYLHLLILAIPLFLIAVLLGFTLIQSATLSGFLVWRLITHEKDHELESENYFVGASVLIALIAYIMGHYNNLPNVNEIIWVLIIQVLFLVIGRLLHNLEIRYGDQVFNKKLKTTFVVFVVTFGLAGLFQLMFPLIRSVFYFILNGLTSFLLFLISPIFNWAESIEPGEKEGEVEESELEDRGQDNQELSSIDGETVITSEHLLIAFITIVTIAILIVIFKNKDQLLSKIQFNREPEDLVKHSTRVKDKKLWKRHSVSRAPHNSIRKAFYKLEKWSQQKGVGRFADESIDEWLYRYELNDLIDDHAITIYKDVRYGDYSIEPEQKKQYVNQIDLIKQSLKQYIANDES